MLDYTANKTQTSPMYFVSACAPPYNGGACQNTARTLTLTLEILTWNSTGTAIRLTKSAINTGDYYNGKAGVAKQPGGYGIRVDESHFSGVSVEDSNGEIYTSAPSSMRGSGGAGVAGSNGFWAYELRPPSIIVQRFQVGGNTVSQPFEAVFPSVTMDGKNNIVWTFSELSSTQHVTPAVAYLPANGSSLKGPHLLNPSAAVASYQGACPSSNPPGMMGNYSDILPDPSNANNLWLYGVYGGSATSCKWTTEAIKFALP